MGSAVILAVTSHSPSGRSCTTRFFAVVPAWYIEPFAIGSVRWPPETDSGCSSSGRSSVQRSVSSWSPSNSSERTGPVGHWSGGAVTRTSTVSLALPPAASVAVNVAVYVPGRV